jgi:hypothetical protein
MTKTIVILFSEQFSPQRSHLGWQIDLAQATARTGTQEPQILGIQRSFFKSYETNLWVYDTYYFHKINSE